MSIKRSHRTSIMTSLTCRSAWLCLTLLMVILPGSSFAQQGWQRCAAVAGTDSQDTRQVFVRTENGRFQVNFNMFNVQPDQLIVFYRGQRLADTGCVVGRGRLDVTLPDGATSGMVTVQVNPGARDGNRLACYPTVRPSPGTRWDYTVFAHGCVYQSDVQKDAEGAGVIVGVSVLLASLIGSIGMALAQGAAAAAGGAGAPAAAAPTGGSAPVEPSTEGPDQEESVGSLPAEMTSSFLDDLAQAISQNRVRWVASGNLFPEAPVAGANFLSKWGGEGYRQWREAMETIDRAINTRPGDVYNPTRIKRQEMADYHGYETATRATWMLRAIRAITGGAGDVASDPKPGFWSVLTGGARSFWDVVGPDPTTIPERMLDPRTEYRDLLESWRQSQSWSRWLRTRTPREPADIRRLIRELQEERMAAQLANVGNDAFFENEKPIWDEELRRLRALDRWLDRAQ